MKATVDRRALVVALKAVAPAVAKASHVAALYCVRVEATAAGLDLTCSNFDITAGALVTDLEGKPKDGVALIPHEWLLRLVEKMAGEHVTIDATAKEASITSGGTAATLRCKHPDDWPKLPPIEGEEVKLDADHVRQLADILPFASTDTNSPIVMGVHFKDGWACCTDKYRLAAFDGFPPELGPILLPAAPLRGLLDDEPAVVTVGDRGATFACGTRTITVRTTEGDYPNWPQLLPKSSPFHLTVDAPALTAAIQRVAALGTTGGVKLTVEDDGLLITAEHVEVGTVADRIGCRATPECPTVSYNPTYLSSLVANTDGEVTLEITDGFKPVVTKVDGRTMLVVPLRPGVK